MVAYKQNFKPENKFSWEYFTVEMIPFYDFCISTKDTF